MIRTKTIKPKHKRLLIILLFFLSVGSSVWLVFRALDESMLYFYTPSDIEKRNVQNGVKLRLGGIVKEGSVKRVPDTLETIFLVTDFDHEKYVTFSGILPDLFREGQGVIVEGQILSDGNIRATKVLAKHDENYMPPEVADALKKSGKWKYKEGNNEY